MTSNIEAPPRQRVGNAASGCLRGSAGWSESDTRRIHDLYVANAPETVGSSPIVAPGAEDISLATSTSWATVQTAPGHASVYQHHSENMLSSRYSRPTACPQMFGLAPQGAKPEGDQAPASLWVCLSGEHDQGGCSSRGYWPLPVRNGTSAPGISAPMMVTRPEVQGLERSGREQLGLKRSRASDGHYGVHDQGGQARRFGSPHRFIKRVPVKLSDKGRSLPPGPSWCPRAPSQMSVGLKKIGARSFMATQAVTQDRSNHVLPYVRADPYGDAATQRLGGDQTRLHIDEDSNPTAGACSTLTSGGNVVAGVAGREKVARALAAPYETLCPCRGLNNHDSLKVQRLSIGRVEIIADGVDRFGVKSQQASGDVGGAVPGRITGPLRIANAVRERCGVFLPNENASLTSGPWEISTFGESQRDAAGSRAGWAWPAGEHKAFWFQEGDGEARAQAGSLGSLSVGTHSSSGCSASRPGAEKPTDIVTVARPQSEPWASAQSSLHMGHAQVDQRHIDRGDDFHIHSGGQRGDNNVEMDVEITGEDHSRRVVEFPSGSTVAFPFRSTLLLLPKVVKKAPEYDLTVSLANRGQEGVAANEAAMTSAPITAAATAEAAEVFEATDAGRGEGSEEAVLAGDRDVDDDSSDATTAHEDISAWLHDMEDWWTP